MLSLLKICVSGYKMLENDFVIDFLAKARVNDEDDSSEVYEIAKNLYTFNMLALTGSNASGKTTTLLLIKKVINLMKTGRWEYQENDFNSDNIKLHLEFFINDDIYSYDSIIMPNKPTIDSEITSPYCEIRNEIIRIAKYNPSYGRRYFENSKFRNLDIKESTIKDTSNLVLICSEHLTGYYLEPFSNNGISVNNNFFNSLDLLSSKLTNSIIQLLDDSIEYIYKEEDDKYRFKRFNDKEKTINKLALLNQLSNGTIKGIELYIRITNLLNKGGILLVDEIENCFHKNLVNNILFLLTDKKINIHNAQIIFTTHYVEILDVFERRDNIFVLHKNNNYIGIDNLYEKYDIRTEILKSKQFNNNTFKTLLNYDKLMEVKRLIKNEILNND